jgi:hypothetical protein
MAEAVPFVAVISSIVQLIDFTSKVVVRLNSILSRVKESPKSLSYLKYELPMLLTILQQIHHAIKEDRLPPRCGMAFPPTIDSYKRLIEEVETTPFKTLLTQIDGKTKAVIISIGSIWNEREIKGMIASLR